MTYTVSMMCTIYIYICICIYIYIYICICYIYTLNVYVYIYIDIYMIYMYGVYCSNASCPPCYSHNQWLHSNCCLLVQPCIVFSVHLHLKQKCGMLWIHG